MKKIFKDIAMAAVIGFAVGALIAFAAPAIAAAAGIESAGIMGNVMFMGLFAGAWGALGAAVTPLANGIAGKFSGGKSAAVKDVNTSSPVHTVEQSMEMDMISNGKFAQMIEAEKARAVELTR